MVTKAGAFQVGFSARIHFCPSNGYGQGSSTFDSENGLEFSGFNVFTEYLLEPVRRRNIVRHVRAGKLGVLV